MEVRLTLSPGRPGTKRLVEKYGEQLVCVRYRYDSVRGMRYKTAELIVDSAPWQPPAEELVSLRVERLERDLQREVKQAGGRWNPREGVWEVRYGEVARMGLQARIVGEERVTYCVAGEAALHATVPQSPSTAVAPPDGKTIYL